MKKRARRMAITFDPGKRGLRKVLGDLEAAIMDRVWKSEEVTVRDVYESVGRGRELAYTTVMTVMSRLAGKGLLKRRKSDNQALVYSATMSREEFVGATTRSVLEGLLSDFGSPSMSHLVEMMDDESEERIAELARLIEEKRRKK